MDIEVATPEDYERALLHIRDNGHGLDNILIMVRAQHRMPGHRITATELAQACGWPDYSSANLHYGNFGFQVASCLNYEPPCRSTGDKKPKWWMAVAYNDGQGDEAGHFQFIMRPALAAALRQMNWL